MGFSESTKERGFEYLNGDSKNGFGLIVGVLSLLYKMKITSLSISQPKSSQGSQDNLPRYRGLLACNNRDNEGC